MIAIDLKGKRGLVMGVANARSLGWAIAEKLGEAGAELAFSYQGERLKADLEKLTQEMAGTRLFQCDVTNEGELKSTFAALKDAWGSLDFVVHSIAFAPRAAMDGRYIETTRDDWRTALEISPYSLGTVAPGGERGGRRWTSPPAPWSPSPARPSPCSTQGARWSPSPTTRPRRSSPNT